MYRSGILHSQLLHGSDHNLTAKHQDRIALSDYYKCECKWVPPTIFAKAPKKQWIPCLATLYDFVCKRLFLFITHFQHRKCEGPCAMCTHQPHTCVNLDRLELRISWGWMKHQSPIVLHHNKWLVWVTHPWHNRIRIRIFLNLEFFFFFSFLAISTGKCNGW